VVVNRRTFLGLLGAAIGLRLKPDPPYASWTTYGSNIDWATGPDSTALHIRFSESHQSFRVYQHAYWITEEQDLAMWARANPNYRVFTPIEGGSPRI